MGKPIKRPDITDVHLQQIVSMFHPETHEFIGVRTELVVGWSVDEKMRFQKFEVVIAKDDLKEALTAKQITGQQEFNEAILKFGLEKM